MGDMLLATQGVPTTPAAGNVVVFPDSTAKKLVALDEAGAVFGRFARNFATASQGPGFASDTFVTNSGLIIPSFGLQAGMVARWYLTLSKTAAGTAAPTYVIQLGTNLSTADTDIVTLTGGAQTAATDNGLLVIQLLIRTAGASGNVVASASWDKTGASGVGFGTASVETASAGVTLDTTGRAGQSFSLSFNGGASAAWTILSLHGELFA